MIKPKIQDPREPEVSNTKELLSRREERDVTDAPFGHEQ